MLSPHLADLILVPSRATADELVRLTGTKAGKIEVIPYGPQQLQAATSQSPDGTALRRHGLQPRDYILALGTLEPRKNHVRLVEAFEYGISSGALRDDISLVIAGQAGWHAEPILSRLKASPFASRIKMLGYVPASDLPDLLRDAAAVAYVSLYEGFGLPIVEAMAVGAPTVTSNISSMPEVAGEAGFLVDPTSIRDIARGLVDAIAAGESDREGVANRARAQAAKFTWERGAQAAIELYESRLS